MTTSKLPDPSPQPVSHPTSAPRSPSASPPAAAGWLLALSTLAAASATPLPVADLRRDAAVDFEKEVLPILQRNCLACHNQTRAKADLVLENPASIAKGGASGPAVVPGKPDESLVFTSSAHRVDDLVMPPVGNKSNAENLTPEELGLLRLWIQQGAQGEVRAARALVWQAIPDSWNSSYAVAVDRDAQLVACARANRVQLYDARTGRPAGRLEDPELHGAAQRDIVSALAFSPTEDLLATAGFQEVRLWRRRAPETRELFRSEPGNPWTAATISNDRATVALVTGSGDVEVRRTDNGAAVASWPAITTSPALISLSPDATRVAVIGSSGTLRVLSVTGLAPTFDQPLGADPAALAWFDGGRGLATVSRGAKTIQTWRFPERPESPQLVPGRNLAAHEATVTCLASDTSGALVSGADDGTVLRWPVEGEAAPASLRCAGPVALLQPTSTPTRLIASLAQGGSAVLEFGTQPAMTHALNGDPRRAVAVAEEEQDLGLARLELSFAEKSIQDIEAEAKKATDTLTKAREKKETQAKALAEKQQSLTQQQQTETAATQERDALTAELQKATDAFAAAEKSAAEARVAAQEAAERSFATRLAAEQADRLKTDLERIVQSVAGRPDEPSLTKAREASDAANADAASKTRLTGEARTRAEKALEELATRSFAAGQSKAVADRANADLPPRKKQAEEKIAAAKKAIADLQPQLEKARIALDGGEKDIQIAEQSADRIAQSLQQAKDAAETARRRIAESETRLKERQNLAGEASRQPHPLAHPTPSGTSLITWNPQGSAIAWDLATGTATFAFQTSDQPPLALLALEDHTALVVRHDSVSRVDFTPRWERHRTIGGGTNTPASGPQALVDRVNALAFSPDGSLLATGGGEPSRSGELKLWSTADGTLARDLGSVHSDCVLAVAFSPRGDRLATGGADRFARITEVGTGKLLRSLEGHTHHVMAVAWLAHGGVLASAGAEGVVKIWNAQTGDRLKNVDSFGKEVTGLRAVGLTNQFVAVAGSGKSRVVRENGEKVRDLPSASSFFQALATPRDGTWAAVAADDGVLRIWDIEAGKERFALPPR
jgi:WD40 repeat protein